MLYDVIIIGSGPSGLTAATYTSRDNLKTLLLGGRKWGGQLMLTSEVENFPGFPKGILGPELMTNMKEQAGRFGTEIKLVNVTQVDFSKRPFTVWTDESPSSVTGQSSLEDAEKNNKLQVTSYESHSVIVATGADTIWLGLPNEQKLIGKGVSSCAPCDAFFFRGKKVIVVGGGDSAMEEAFVLSKFATEVTIVHRRDDFRASKIMQDRTLSLPNVKTIMNASIVDILGENKVEGVILQSTDPDHYPLNANRLQVDGIFVAIGHTPNTEIFKGHLELDEKGYITKGNRGQGTGNSQTTNYSMSTTVDGVFVAGDVHDHHFQQAVTAAGFGCMAALEVSHWLAANP